MAEPLKDSFGVDVIDAIAAQVQLVHPSFDRARFIAYCTDGYADLELTPRARRIAEGLAQNLPQDRSAAIAILHKAVEAWPAADGSPMGPFVHLPAVFFVAEHGLDHFEQSMELQRELTKRFTAEFSIRAFIEAHPEQTMRRLAQWATDPDEHVRRLVSEGTRPRLPWARRLPVFQADPSPVLDLLEVLKDDPSEYVRRSVANNLNDIAKDNPDLVVEVARRWLVDASPERRRMVRHGLRSLIKAGHGGALEAMGFGHHSGLSPVRTSIEPSVAAIGTKVVVAVDLHNPGAEAEGALVDIRIHFVKADGSTSAKVFKGAEIEVEPDAVRTVRKTISVAQQSTRRHYSGWHAVELLVNGRAIDLGGFELV